jgi:hypothetical protein
VIAHPDRQKRQFDGDFPCFFDHLTGLANAKVLVNNYHSFNKISSLAREASPPQPSAAMARLCRVTARIRVPDRPSIQPLRE